MEIDILISKELIHLYREIPSEDSWEISILHDLIREEEGLFYSKIDTVNKATFLADLASKEMEIVSKCGCNPKPTSRTRIAYHIKESKNILTKVWKSHPRIKDMENEYNIILRLLLKSEFESAFQHSKNLCSLIDEVYVDIYYTSSI